MTYHPPHALSHLTPLLVARAQGDITLNLGRGEPDADF
jgi:hypothetical protein